MIDAAVDRVPSLSEQKNTLAAINLGIMDWLGEIGTLGKAKVIIARSLFSDANVKLELNAANATPQQVGERLQDNANYTLFRAVDEERPAVRSTMYGIMFTGADFLMQHVYVGREIVGLNSAHVVQRPEDVHGFDTLDLSFVRQALTGIEVLKQNGQCPDLTEDLLEIERPTHGLHA